MKGSVWREKDPCPHVLLEPAPTSGASCWEPLLDEFHPLEPAPTSHVRGTNVRGTNVRGTNVRGTNVRGTNVRGTNVRGTNVRGTNVRGTNVRGTNVRGTNVRGTNVRGTNVRGTNVRGTNVRGTNVRGLCGADWSRSWTSFIHQSRIQIVMCVGLSRYTICSTSAASLLHRRNCRLSPSPLLFATCGWSTCDEGQLLLTRVLGGEELVAMERDEGAELDTLWNFVQEESPGASTVSASVRCTISILRNELLGLSVELRRTRTGDHQVCDGRDTEILILNLRFRVQDAILQAFEMLVACPTLTDLSLSFPFQQDQDLPRSQERPINGLVLHLFAVVCTSRSLTTLGISFAVEARFRCRHDEGSPLEWHNVSLDVYGRNFFYAKLPILLRDNPLFEKLTFYYGWTADSSRSYLAYCFTRNPNLISCALATLRYSERVKHDCFPLEGVVRLFKPVVQSDPLNVEVMRELVIKTNPLDHRCGSCEHTIARMVDQNSTLERLEVDEYLVHHKDKFCWMARALECNQSLKVLGSRCTTADFKQLVRYFVPDASGCQANTSLLTLKLSFPKRTEAKDCMIVLAQLLGSNTTLKHVELSLDLLNSRRGEKDRQRRIREKLEQMLNNELRRNTCLQSLCVGSWRLVRVGAGDQWEMRFVGPCLGLKEYVVKVKM